MFSFIFKYNYLLLFVATLMMMADLSPSSTTSWWCSWRRQIHYKQVKRKKPGELEVVVGGGRWVSECDCRVFCGPGFGRVEDAKFMSKDLCKWSGGQFLSITFRRNISDIHTDQHWEQILPRSFSSLSFRSSPSLIPYLWDCRDGPTNEIFISDLVPDHILFVGQDLVLWSFPDSSSLFHFLKYPILLKNGLEEQFYSKFMGISSDKDLLGHEIKIIEVKELIQDILKKISKSKKILMTLG